MKELSLSIGPAASPQFQIQTPGDVKTYALNDIISTFASLLLFFAIIITLFFLISGGVDIIMAGGEKQKIENGRNKLKSAIAGLIIALSSFIIVNLIGHLFGVKLLSPSF